MYTSEILLDMHERSHRAMRKAMAWLAADFSTEELSRELPGFGFPSIKRQLKHTIAAELYWLLVLTTGYKEEVQLPDYPDIAALEAFRAEVYEKTRAYIQSADEAELNTERSMEVDPEIFDTQVPAHVIVRLVTHIFNHQGQILAMARTLGKPNEVHDLDYPITAG